jgi:WD40-like Beta Propeller Repeat
MAFPYANLGSALLVSIVVAASAASCGGSASSSGSSSTHGGTSGSHSAASGTASGGAGGAGSAGTNSGGSGGAVSFASGVGVGGSGGSVAGLDVTPTGLQTLLVTAGQTMPTQAYKATLNGKAINVGWGVDLGNVGTIPAGPSSSAVFAPTGSAGGLVTITAGLNGMTVQRQVMIKLSAQQNGPTQGEQGQVPTMTSQLTSGGGVGGVGGEGLGPAVTDTPTITALGAPSGNGQAQGLTFLYPYDKTVWPRGLLAPLLMWTWSTGDADAIQIGLKTSNGSFSYTGTFGKPAILGATGKFIRSPIPQDVWDEATNSAGGSASTLTVSLTVAKGGVAYGPISETWTIAPARLSGTIYYQSYGTQLALNATEAVGGNHLYGGAVLSIHVGDTGPKLTAGGNSATPGTDDATQCRVCHSVAALGTRLVVSEGDNYSARSAYDLSPNGATEHVLTNEGPWFPGVYPDGSLMLTADGLLLPLPSDATPITTVGLPGGSLDMPAFSPDGTLVAFNPNLGGQIDVMRFAAATATFSNQITVVSDTGSVTPGWPAFFPDSKSIVFEQESAPSQIDGHGSNILWTREGAEGQLAWASVSGTASVTPLDQLNGKGYLPTGPTPTLSCIGDEGFEEGSSLAVHDDDVDKNYEPTVNPIASGGYAWVVFTSRRMYGTVANIPPYCSDPRGVDLIENTTPKKLWVAAVDLTQAPGTDSSHPAFYLPGQELLAGNSRGFWVLDPCQADGTSCMTGDQCCNGYCEADGDGGALVCSNMPPSSTCSMPGDKCKTSADCCDAGDVCLNGFCSQSTPG